MFVPILWSIIVHSWGGLGSQLFALIVAKRLKKRFPNRTITLVFHSAGVTRRRPEAQTLISRDFRIKIKSDFRDNVAKILDSNKVEKRSKSIIELIKLVLVRLGFISEVQSQQELNDISQLIFATRGHYTNIELDKEDLDYIQSIFQIRSNSHYTYKREIAIHYRLGDLLILRSKSFLDPSQVIHIVNQCFEPNTNVTIYTDSAIKDIPDQIMQAMAPYGGIFKNLEALEVVQSCVNAHTFIGTNSKLSLWIAMLRYQRRDDLVTYLPNSLAAKYGNLMKNIDRHNLVIPY